MTTSGTVGQTTIEVADILDKAARRCKVEPSRLTPELVEVMRQNLWLLLANLSNRGVNLWRIYRPLYGLYPNQAEYPLNVGDVDLLNIVYRTPVRLSASVVTSSAGGTVANLTDADVTTAATQTAPNGSFAFDWGAGVTNAVALLGCLSAASGSYHLVAETSNDGASWSQIKDFGVQTFTAGGWFWAEIEPAGYPARYFRVRETAGGTLSMSELVCAATYNDVTMSQMNRDDYFAMPNKRQTSSGSPPQWMLDRQTIPRLIVWPIPSNTFTLIALMVHRHIQDVGALNNTIDVPIRWQSLVISALAYDSILELPEADLNPIRLQQLKAAKDEIMFDSESEEGDGAPIKLTPSIGAYTA